MTMRDEYDFSNAMPNRYAQRMAAQPISTPTTRGEQPPTGVIQIYRDTRDEYRWRLVIANGEVLATSAQSYPNLDACHRAVDAFVRATAHPATTESGAA
ncbi:MAG: DUF1508 domain-containing protein [Planctomycetes bacterium]|nr:DUF1508 domain-containing protein [Planctomycetota bacterium]